MGKNPINPDTGTPFRGRKPKSGWFGDQRSGDIERISEPEHDSGGTESRSSGGWWGVGNASLGERESSRNNERTADTGSAGETPERVGSQSYIDVEQPTEKPKRTYTRKSKAGPITAVDFEGYIVLSFTLLANIQQRPWWKIQPDEKVEIESFSQNGANLMNRVLAEHAQKVKDGGDVFSVGAGIINLVFVRMQQDAQMRMLAARRKQEVNDAGESLETSQPLVTQYQEPTNGLAGNDSKASIFGNPQGLS